MPLLAVPVVWFLVGSVAATRGSCSGGPGGIAARSAASVGGLTIIAAGTDLQATLQNDGGGKQYVTIFLLPIELIYLIIQMSC